MSQAGHGAQVVEVLDDHTYRLNEEMLKGILLQEGIKDLPVVMVSVAGAYRGGKSFLLNLFLRYLQSNPSARADGSWLSEDSEPIKGFSWRGGIKRNTTGILLWSEPILMSLASGEKVVVLLMDTQGTFDSDSTMRDCSTIFALSTLLSSVEIYNLSKNIQEDDLQHLELFTEYGRMLYDQHGAKAFQVLQFLVRDWVYVEDYAYGAVGGKQYLAEKLAIKKTMAPEIRDLRNHLSSSFEKLTCFLMPHPGHKVEKKSFSGTIADIEPDFRQHVIGLVSSLFSPETLTPKRINGELVRARVLFTYFKTYMSLFNSDKIPSTTTIMEATVRAGMLAAVSDARTVYELGMDGECGERQPSVPAHDLQHLHQKYVAKARAAFNNKRKMGSPKQAETYLNTLIKELEDKLPLYRQLNLSKTQNAINRAKDTYEQMILTISKGKLLCVHALDLEQVHNEARDAAMKQFDASRKSLSTEVDKEREAFKKSFETRRSLLRLSNEQNNYVIAVQLRMEYWSYMQAKCNTEPPLSEATLNHEHETALKKAEADFDSKRNRPNHYTEDVFKHTLTQDIQRTFENIKKINESKNKMAINAGIAEYIRYMESAWNSKTECLHPSDFENEHKSGKCRALVTFRPTKSCTDGFDINDSDEQTLLESIGQHYSELKRINDRTNESAVEEAYNMYCSTMDDLCRPTLWWLLIVPIFVYMANKSSYHDTAVNKAIEVFRSKRRSTSFSEDYYLQLLRKRMDDAYSNY